MQQQLVCEGRGRVGLPLGFERKHMYQTHCFERKHMYKTHCTITLEYLISNLPNRLEFRSA